MTAEPRNRASERVRRESPKYGDRLFVTTQLRGLIADHFVREGRRSVVGVPETDADGWVEQLLAFHDLGSGSRVWLDEVAAVRGERFAPCWICVGAAVLASADRALCEAAERQGLHIADPLTA